MQHYETFHLGLHCLQKYLFMGFSRVKTDFTQKALIVVAWFQSDHFFFFFIFCFLIKNDTSILIDINNVLPIPLMWYLFILTILTTGPRLVVS